MIPMIFVFLHKMHLFKDKEYTSKELYYSNQVCYFTPVHFYYEKSSIFPCGAKLPKPLGNFAPLFR